MGYAVNASLDFTVNGTNIVISNNTAYTVVASAYTAEDDKKIGCAFLPASDTMCDVNSTYICRTSTNVAAPCVLTNLLSNNNNNNGGNNNNP